MLVRMRMLAVLVRLMTAIMFPVRMRMVLMLIVLVSVRGSFMDAKFDSLDSFALLALEVHVKIAQRELGKFPLESGRLDAEIDERTDRHIAADARCAIEEKDFHEI